MQSANRSPPHSYKCAALLALWHTPVAHFLQVTFGHTCSLKTLFSATLLCPHTVIYFVDSSKNNIDKSHAHQTCTNRSRQHQLEVGEGRDTDPHHPTHTVCACYCWRARPVIFYGLAAPLNCLLFGLSIYPRLDYIQ